jgi:hypothetical protein
VSIRGAHSNVAAQTAGALTSSGLLDLRLPRPGHQQLKLGLRLLDRGFSLLQFGPHVSVHQLGNQVVFLNGLAFVDDDLLEMIPSTPERTSA